jgi:peptidoglycan/xylan/chitin deacetylase (PgdA/CDA1 family)
MGAALSRRQRAAQLLDASGVGALLRRLAPWSGVLAFAYHRIGDARAAEGDRSLWSVTADTLDAQLRVLAREADVVGVDALREPSALRRGRHVLLTFDDGYRDAYDEAYPLLRAHGLTAAFFLSTSFLDAPRPSGWDEIAWMVRRSEHTGVAGVPFDQHDREGAVRRLVGQYHRMPAELAPGYLDALGDALGTGRCPREAAADTWLTWDLAREMRDGGMTFGGHTHTHPVLARLSEEEQRVEVLECRRRLARELGQAMLTFSYPVGGRDTFDARTKACLWDAGVELAFSSYGGIARADAWDPLDIRRVSPGPTADPAVLRAAVTLPGRFARW